MGRYVPGDVLLASVRLGKAGACKTRPVVVTRSLPGGELLICPISCSIRPDEPSYPLGLADFLKGGLDICEESFILIGRELRIRQGEVIGKKGTLCPSVLEDILRQGER